MCVRQCLVALRCVKEGYLRNWKIDMQESHMPSGNARVQCSRPQPGAMATLVRKCSAWTFKCSQNTLEPSASCPQYELCVLRRCTRHSVSGWRREMRARNARKCQGVPAGRSLAPAVELSKGAEAGKGEYSKMHMIPCTQCCLRCPCWRS